MDEPFNTPFSTSAFHVDLQQLNAHVAITDTTAVCTLLCPDAEFVGLLNTHAYSYYKTCMAPN